MTTHATIRTETRCKLDDELRIVYGEVYAPDVIDSQGDTMSAAEIRKMAHHFLAEGRVKQIDVQHNNQVCGAKVVESFIAREGDPTFIPSGRSEGVLVLRSY